MIIQLVQVSVQGGERVEKKEFEPVNIYRKSDGKLIASVSQENVIVNKDYYVENDENLSV